MKSAIIKRSIVIGGHKTSISLEDQFWKGLKDICEERGTTLSAQVQAIDAERKCGNLSSAVRLFVLDFYRSAAEPREPLESVPLAPVTVEAAHTPA
jgi:predicted DNA-binding ribbon-helix-helix protein